MEVLRRCDDLWFADGTIALQAQTTLFWVDNVQIAS